MELIRMLVMLLSFKALLVAIRYVRSHSDDGSDDCSLIKQLITDIPHHSLHGLLATIFQTTESGLSNLPLRHAALELYDNKMMELVWTLHVENEKDIMYIKYDTNIHIPEEVKVLSVDGVRGLWPSIHNIQRTEEEILVIVKNSCNFMVIHKLAGKTGFVSRQYWIMEDSYEEYQRRIDQCQKRNPLKLLSNAHIFISQLLTDMAINSLSDVPSSGGCHLLPSEFFEDIHSVCQCGYLAVVVLSSMLQGEESGEVAALSDEDRTLILQYLQRLSTSDCSGSYILGHMDVNHSTIDVDTILDVAVKSGHLLAVRNIITMIQPKIRYRLLRSLNRNLIEYIHLYVFSRNILNFVTWAKEIPPDSYFLASKPILLVICCRENRDGADREVADILKLRSLFDIKVITDPTESEVLDKLRQIQLQTDMSALFVVVMAHGVNGYFRVKDKFMNLRDLTLQMCPSCWALIPKVLILQACQSWHGRSATDPGGSESSSSDPVPCTRQLSHFYRGREGDFNLQSRNVAILMATESGGEAERNFFIPLLVDQMIGAAKLDTIEDVFYRTHEVMENQIPTQMPIMKTTLTKRLRFKNFYHSEGLL